MNKGSKKDQREEEEKDGVLLLLLFFGCSASAQELEKAFATESV